MLTKREFVTMSLDLNLFFLRIMKEHSFFLQVGFMPKDSSLTSDAANFRTGFEQLLRQAIVLANGNISRNALDSQQIITQHK